MGFAFVQVLWSQWRSFVVHVKAEGVHQVLQSYMEDKATYA
jgi:hypothetical protein